jgi:chitinase
MKSSTNYLLQIVLFSSLAVPALAYSAASTVTYSPYVDTTLNVHWDPQYQDLEPADLLPISESSGVKNFHLAFITDAGNCSPAWGAQSTYSTSTGWGSHLTDKLRENHIRYIVSFGGATGNDLSNACSEEQLAAAYEQVIKTYQPDGLDFDIENGTANVSKIMQALQQVQSAHANLKISFTLPVLPEGLVSAGQNVVKQAQASKLVYSVNIMAMDYGPSYVNDMGEYAIQAATNLFTFLKSLYPDLEDSAVWNMIEVTPMIGVNDVSVEQFTLADADAVRDFANQNNLKSLSIWSANRDYPCADKWARLNCSGNNLQSVPYEFAKHFLQ